MRRGRTSATARADRRLAAYFLSGRSLDELIRYTRHSEPALRKRLKKLGLDPDLETRKEHR